MRGEGSCAFKFLVICMNTRNQSNHHLSRMQYIIIRTKIDSFYEQNRDVTVTGVSLGSNQNYFFVKAII